MITHPAYLRDSLSRLIRKICFEVRFPFICFQWLLNPSVATQLCRFRQLVHQRLVQSGPLVLGSTLLNFLTLMADRDRTVSRRSEPNSRTTLIGEQPNPWELLHPRDVMSRHRGAKRFRR